jgi:hypothetical protein
VIVGVITTCKVARKVCLDITLHAIPAMQEEAAALIAGLGFADTQSSS